MGRALTQTGRLSVARVNNGVISSEAQDNGAAPPGFPKMAAALGRERAKCVTTRQGGSGALHISEGILRTARLGSTKRGHRDTRTARAGRTDPDEGGRRAEAGGGARAKEVRFGGSFEMTRQGTGGQPRVAHLPSRAAAPEGLCARWVAAKVTRQPLPRREGGAPVTQEAAWATPWTVPGRPRSDSPREGGQARLRIGAGICAATRSADFRTGSLGLGGGSPTVSISREFLRCSACKWWLWPALGGLLRVPVVSRIGCEGRTSPTESKMALVVSPHPTPGFYLKRIGVSAFLPK